MIVFHNTHWLPKDQIKITPFCDSFMYGFGVFETLRTANGKILRLEEHLDRLFHSADIIGLKTNFTRVEIIERCLESLEKTSFTEIRLKIVLTETDLLIIPQKLDLRPLHWYKEGIRVITFNIERSLAEAKSLNCVTNLVARQEADKKGVYEVLLIDDQGIAREGSWSNLFWVKDEVVYTTKTKILPGITRQIVLEIAEQEFKLELKDELLQNILLADEVFVTNTTSNILPVVQIKDTLIDKGKVGSVTKKLIELFDKKCNI